ncbi:CoxG family protein [Bradyrhizobium mercantei]|uniref:CoxG family protein n=1 Tax=Bradyrhizobium mercantei TaxID=1904807 RepID=UPI00097816E8|nr:carbon monoxide dehydrogenase subunit G [Bradyrhizobium mercantei]
MELNDSIVIPAPPARVFAALSDPLILRGSIPGCETLDRIDNDRFDATVVLRIGPIKARFGGQVKLDSSGAPDHFSLSGEGSGGMAGFAKGAAHVQLAAVPEGTCLTYKVDAQIGGKLAQLGSRLVLGAARTLAATFFERFSRELVQGTDSQF